MKVTVCLYDDGNDSIKEEKWWGRRRKIQGVILQEGKGIGIRTNMWVALAETYTVYS